MRMRIAAALAVLLGGAAQAAPANFIYTGDFEAARPLFSRPDIEGVQVIFNWKMLEPEKGVYDFSGIAADLAVTDALGKKLVVQVQDRFFSPEARNIPAYLLREPEYGGGLVPQVDNPGADKAQAYGWAAMQWNAALRGRYQALLAALAKAFDGRIFAINLPETSIDVDDTHDDSGFSCDAYFAGEMENLRAARAAFQSTHVVQYVNFWPCEWENDHNYMGRMFAFAAANGVGLGGPDIVPYRKGQMKNSYPFFNQYKGKLSFVGMAVQEPTLTYKNDNTGRPFTRQEFVDFATDYLGVDAIFWATSTPWLNSGE